MQRHRFLRLLSGIVGIAMIVVGGWWLATMDLQVHRVSTPVMGHSPRLHEIVLIEQLADPDMIRRGDVLMFNGAAWFNEPSIGGLIGRAVGIAGDRVMCCDPSGDIRVNGQAVREAHVVGTNEPFQDFEVPGGAVFILGDARESARDSRHHTGPLQGAVPVSAVTGRLVDVAWPPWRIRTLDDGRELRDIEPAAGHAPSRGHRPAGGLVVIGLVILLSWGLNVRRRSSARHA